MTRLFFEAPPDLSIGRVRVVNESGPVAEWIATQDNRSFSREHTDPGFYAAEISPIGKPPQSVVFQVKADQENEVRLPPFAALATTGDEFNFLNVDDRGAAIAALFSRPESAVARISRPERVDSAQEPAESPARAKRRRLSVGLSIERGKRDAFGRFQGKTRVALSNIGLEIEIHAADDWSPWSSERIRLSVAIENTRVERLLLPMYRGGTTVSVIPSRIADGVELEVKPVDANIRALLNTLGGGTMDEASALKYRLDDLTGFPLAGMPGNFDPWEAMLWGLLYLRFPDVFGPVPTMMMSLFARNIDWAYDAHVIEARRQLSAAGDELHTIDAAIADALRSLARAQTAGSPYFSYTNQLFNDMLQSLVNYEPLAAVLRPKLERILKRATRKYPLQRSAGYSFSWLSRDPELVKNGMLVPNRRSSGMLRSRDTNVLFAGSIERGRISFDTRSRKVVKGLRDDSMLPLPMRLDVDTVLSADPPRSPEEATRFFKVAEVDNDPNAGRFGGRSEAGGFLLRAEFARASERDWVTITLVVEAREDHAVRLGDTARFHLHPTFSPDQVDVMFRGRRAVLTVKAWGGFVVGVRLIRQEISLECNLAQLPDAPRIIRER